MKLSSTLTSQLVLFSNTKHITKKVTEEISQKNLKSFLKTALFHEHYPITKNTKIFYSYIKETNLYEIYIFSTPYKQPLLEIQLFENYPHLHKNRYQLFITNSFFTIYSYGKVIIAYENKNYDPNDIVKFIQFTHKITIEEIITINDEEYHQLKLNTTNLKPLPYLSIASSYEQYYFLVYLLLVILLSFYFYTITYNQPLPKQQTITTEPLYKNEKISLKITQFIQNLNSKNIKLQELQYDKKLFAKIESKNQNIHDFIALYKKDMKIIRLEKKGDNLLYAEVEIEF
jgi:hypothetical protein